MFFLRKPCKTYVKKLILVKTLTIQVNMFKEASYQASENPKHASTVHPFKRTAT